VDQQLKAFGLRVLRTPVRAPKANPYCERLVGSIRRECLDFMIPLGEKHLRRILAEWVTHYNQGRPHLSLGPGIPEPAAYSYRCKVTIDIPSSKTARVEAIFVRTGSWLARFSGASITNTGGKRSPREGREELRGHSALLASPQFLVAVRVGLPVPFVCNETHELGKELVGSYRYQVHLLHWLESNVYGAFLSDKRSTYRYRSI
jgi:hypothetical protein